MERTELTTEVAAPRGEELLLAARLDGKTYPRLSHYTRPEAVAQMKPIVMMAYNYRGQNMAPDTVEVVSSALVDELLRNEYGTASISFAEIREVIRREVLLAENFYISVASLYRVIITYAKGQGTELQRKAAKIAQDRTQAEMRKSVVGTIVSAYAGEFLLNQKINNQ